MPIDPAPCQSRGCDTPAALVVWFETPSAVGAPELLCRRCASLRTDAVRSEGGALVRVETIAALPAARYQQT